MTAHSRIASSVNSDSVLRRKLAITVFPNAKAVNGKTHEKSLLDISAEIIHKRNVPLPAGADIDAAKKKSRLIRLALFAGDTRASGAARVIQIDGVEADYDDGKISIEEAARKLAMFDVAALLYTSPKHTPAEPRWRALVPTSKHLSGDVRAALLARINGIFDGKLDARSFEPKRCYYVDTVGDNPHHKIAIVDGEAIDLLESLDVLAVIPTGERQKADKAEPAGPGELIDATDAAFVASACEREGARDVTRTKSALDALPAEMADDRARWIEIGMAVHQEFGGSAEGFALWDEWSRQSQAYGETKEVWASFGKSSPKVTIGTLFHHAKLNGWNPKTAPRDHIRLISNPDGVPRAILANAIALFTNDEQLRGLVYFDGMQRSVMLARSVPGGKVTLRAARPIKDGDIIAIQEYLQRSGLTAIGKETTRDAVAKVAEEDSKNELTDYLDELQWDSQARLETAAMTYFKANDTLYARAIIRMFMISLVARAYEPGCKADYALMLEGAQGCGKSTAASILGGKWYGDGLPDIGSDDVRTSTYLRGKWVIEIAELASLRKTEAKELKAFLTRNEESFIPKYGRFEVKEPRSCMFILTHNPDGVAPLTDTTGNRRIWPLRCGALIDNPALRRDRDQLFAEAVALYRAGAPRYPSAEFEAAHFEPQQDARRERHHWYEPIQHWLQMVERGEVDGFSHDGRAGKVETLNVAERALGLTSDRCSTAQCRDIARIMTACGWVQKRGALFRFWIRPEL